MLTGALAPDSGTVKLGANLAMAALDQHRDSLDPDTTVADALTGGGSETIMVGGQPRHVDRLHEGFPVRRPNRPARRSASCPAASAAG